MWSSRSPFHFLFLALIMSAPGRRAEQSSKSVGEESKLKDTSQTGKERDSAKMPPDFMPRLPKDVAIIGGGIAGIAAARVISKDRTNFTVKVYEQHRSRYGGRIWTDKLRDMRAKGPEVDLGGAKLSVMSKHNPLIELAESFDLKTTSIGNARFIIPWTGHSYTGDSFGAIAKKALKVVSQAQNESQSLEIEVSMKEAVDKVLESGSIVEQNSPEAQFVKCLPSYVIKDYSSRNYRLSDLDLGFDTVLLDGMGELVDRLVSGDMDQAPLHVALNKAVRQIKVDEDRDKVVVRFRDGSQVVADVAVVAVPVTVLANSGIMFEPELPPKYRLAASEITMCKFNKVAVEFEHAFWPAENGVFVRAVRAEGERGRMQAWLNIHKLIDKPVLIAFFLEDSAVELEQMSQDELQRAVLSVLTEMFGEASVVTGGKIVGLHRSNWVSDEFFKGSCTFKGVGTDPKYWDTFVEPLCPFLYFAGEHTDSESLGTIHGAYNSGLRAGEQILSGLCDMRMEEQRRAEEEKRKKKESGEEEEEEDDVDDDDDQDVKDEL